MLLSFLSFMESYTVEWFIVCLVTILVLIIVIIFMRFQISKIALKKHSLELKNTIQSNKVTTLEIRKNIIRTKLKDSIWFREKENLEYLIEKVKERSNVKNYSFTISKQLILFVYGSILLSGLISKVLGFSDEIESFIKVFKYIFVLLFLPVAYIVIIDIFILKGLYEDKIKKQRRLTEILDELYVEIFLIPLKKG